MELLFGNENNKVYYHNFLELLYIYRKNRLVATIDTINKGKEEVNKMASNYFESLKKLDR